MVGEQIREIVDSDSWRLRYPTGRDAPIFLKWRASKSDEEWVALGGASDAEWSAEVKGNSAWTLRPEGGCACGSSGDAACGAGGVMAWERGRGKGARGAEGFDVDYALESDPMGTIIFGVLFVGFCVVFAWMVWRNKGKKEDKNPQE